MVTGGMVKKAPRSISAAPGGKRPRGRPPKPGGRIPQVEVQRAYRARLAAAGKVVRVVDAVSVRPAPANLASTAIPDFDPARRGGRANLNSASYLQNYRRACGNFLPGLQL